MHRGLTVHLPFLLLPSQHYLSPAHSLPLSPWEKALALCQQHEPLPLSSFFTDKYGHNSAFALLNFSISLILCVWGNRKVKSVNKLGEGTFAEVFGYTSGTGKSLAIKVFTHPQWYMPIWPWCTVL